MGLLKRVGVIAMTFVMIMGLSSCGGNDISGAEAEDASEETKKYIIATDVVFPPFEFQNNAGEYVGIDMDLLAAIAENQGFTYEIKPMILNNALQALEAGKIDAIMAGMSITEEREEKFDFSEP